MMIINLNLLPPHRRERVHRLIKFLLTKNLLEFVIIATAFIGTVLLWGWIILIDEYKMLAQNSISISRDYATHNSEVRRVNRVLKSVNDASSDYMPILPRLLEIISSTPSTIKINTVDINRVENKIIIYGTASTRAELLAYQETIKAIPWMETAIMPTTQLLQKENINFEYITRLKNWPAIKSGKPPTAR
ncbi:MAG: hypothetical protein WCT40_03765 [Candidatus Magasanikbacteria bacterium]|jgi:hypothetical protein